SELPALKWSRQLYDVGLQSVYPYTWPLRGSPGQLTKLSKPFPMCEPSLGRDRRVAVA
ncbi:hypothetical protein J6590_103551, partial [Homalodisca vitripennis]